MRERFRYDVQWSGSCKFPHYFDITYVENSDGTQYYSQQIFSSCVYIAGNEPTAKTTPLPLSRTLRIAIVAVEPQECPPSRDRWSRC